MLWFTRLGVVLLVIIASPSSLACDGGLEELVVFALAHRQEIKVMNDQLELAKRQISVHHQKRYPEVSFLSDASLNKDQNYAHQFKEQNIHFYPVLRWSGVHGTHLRLAAEQRIGKTNNDRNSQSALSVSVEQPLLKGLNRSVSLYPLFLAEVNYQTTFWNARLLVEEIIQAVISSYYQYQSESQMVEYRLRQQEQAKLMLKTIETKIEQGLLAPNEKKQVVLQYLQAQLAYQQSVAAFEHFQSQIEDTLGGAHCIRQASIPQARIIDDDLNAQLDKIIEHNTLIKILALQKILLDKQKAMLLDDKKLDLRLRSTVNIGRFHDFEDKPWYSTKSYATHLSLDIPITPQYEANYALYQNRTDYEHVHQQLLTAKRKLLSELNQKRTQMTLLKQQLELATHAKELALENYQSAKRKLEMGRSSAFDVGLYMDKAIEAQNQYSSLCLRAIELQTGQDMATGELFRQWKDIIIKQAPLLSSL